ncbi:hypothetical protein [Streptomyces sp. NPDC051677]|uniref:hypothetical protein n=1 Tax=Streptomyces sp. NPDC051677 TaxID=3365669 RepID=UPI0037D83541
MTSEQSDPGYDWVTQMPVPDFVQVVRDLRKLRENPSEARAVRALHAFAVRRPVGELVELAHYFDRRDAVMLMATAALSRPVEEAAQMADLQQKAESQGKRAPITATIVHDVACQRTAFDVAVFVRVLKDRRQPALAERTVDLFASPGSGRTNLDKALLHIALRDEGCAVEADRLLELTLLANADCPPDTGVIGGEGEEIGDLAGAFRHLSPTRQILEDWVEARLRDPDATEVEKAQHLVARLIAVRGSEYDALAGHIGRIAKPWNVVQLCALLAKKEASPGKCTLVRRQAAGYKDGQELADLVSCWYEEPALTRTTRNLLADVVARPDAPGRSPRPLGQLNQMAGWLRAKADPECTRLLRLVAVEEVEGRSGAELVDLLRHVEGGRERTRAAHEAGRRLAMAVRRPGADPDRFVDCLRALHDAKYSTAVRAACRELSDPSRERKVDSALVADVAERLHGVKLRNVAWDLLERFLENEQLVAPADVVEIVRGVPSLSARDAQLLLRATVGRWSDVGRRDKAEHELRSAGLGDAAGWVLKSLR